MKVYTSIGAPRGHLDDRVDSAVISVLPLLDESGGFGCSVVGDGVKEVVEDEKEFKQWFLDRGRVDKEWEVLNSEGVDGWKSYWKMEKKIEEVKK